LVGDPCYCFSRITKERYLKDRSACFLFVEVLENSYLSWLNGPENAKMKKGVKNNLKEAYQTLMKDARAFMSSQH